MSNSVREYRPSGFLQPYVEFFWRGDFNLNQRSMLAQRVVPNGYVELIIHLSDPHCELLQDSRFESSPDYTLIGLFTKPYDVRFRSMVEVFGIRFTPEGIYHLFGVPAAEFKEGYADMESVSGRAFRDFCSRLRELRDTGKMIVESERYLSKNLDQHQVDLYYLNRAASLIRKRNGILTMEELTNQVYISTRQLEREFKRKIGLTPKQYMRISKLNAVQRRLGRGRPLSLTGLAYECGYYDQAHFIRDFKKFIGQSPRIFLGERDRYIVNAGDSAMASQAGME